MSGTTVFVIMRDYGIVIYMGGYSGAISARSPEGSLAQ